MAEIRRKIDKRLELFIEDKSANALLITGARQVGKTYAVEHFLEESGVPFAKIDFIEQPEFISIFKTAHGSEDLLLRLSAASPTPLVAGKSVVFFDEVQECKELVTAIKYLVKDGRYKYILSGSLLGVELSDIRSEPVGYLDIVDMFPLDFEEFSKALGVSDEVFSHLKDAFLGRKPVDDFVHERMMDVFRLYLVVGGMPAAVAKYLESNDLQKVVDTQQGIIRLYKRDISKYSRRDKLYLSAIYDAIPGELNRENKRFRMSAVDKNFKPSRYGNGFVWLSEAGVALPVYCVDEPKLPLKISRATNRFKLFSSDVGLLAAQYMNGIQLRVLNREKDVNFGSVYENFVAQELRGHGFELYYYGNSRRGELDFLIDYEGEALPIEVKAGKAYKLHSAMDHCINTAEYGINRALVLCNENVEVAEKVLYLPIYFSMFLKNDARIEDPIYKLDLSGLR